ncbi:hypothetical protein M5W68_21005 [Paenibacillus larvae]|uniref:hypothetical protein n=1 Tax=Paenibacillus larvae TaxID=1464 RepID=UPI00227F179A|nr:hypothetical protein [Paenibacillus larvae]MCY9511282.1 hypothetical protein [Paenibacillus larvae]MCY9527505.1 hypothetical protein [Paenibacillus larvae]
MVKMVVVRICADRIVNGGLNPKTKKTYVIEDITNPDYRCAVEDYILEYTEEV